MKTKTAVNGLASLVLAGGLTGCGPTRYSSVPPPYAGNQQKSVSSADDQQKPAYACKDMSANRPADKSAPETCTLMIRDGPARTTPALVTMYDGAYSITRDSDHQFQRFSAADVLRWSSTKFYDGNMATFFDLNRDGVVDFIDVHYPNLFVTRKPGEEDVKLYKSLLGMIEKDFVHSLWKQRWNK